MNSEIQILYNKAFELLKELIAIPSFSKEEERTATCIQEFLQKENIQAHRIGNNVFAVNEKYDPSLPALLLNSHHDTVRPNASYRNDPFSPIEKNGKLFGLGSNDAGASLVCLLVTFLYFYKKKTSEWNLVIAATAEEEISGTGGIEFLLNSKEFISVTEQNEATRYSNWAAIVGEPTQLQLATAERGLMVLDCITEGIAGHAAREEGESALYKAVDDINWFRNYRFAKVSNLLGPVKQTVSVIETDNKTHNIIPSVCKYVVDVRLNELYSFDEILTTIRQNIKGTATPRSTRLRSTLIHHDHPLVKAGTKLGSNCYGSPTTSDKSLIPFPALKVGPGDSARSHIADEYIYIDDIKSGIEFYTGLLNQFL